jgi:tetratricopeptide (TPR) repeat protein
MRIILGLILGLVLGLSNAVAQEMSWEERMKAGDEAYERGEYERAELHYNAGILEAERFEPKDPRLATNLDSLAIVHYAQEAYAEAEPLLQRALALGVVPLCVEIGEAGIAG